MCDDDDDEKGPALAGLGGGPGPGFGAGLAVAAGLAGAAYHHLKKKKPFLAGAARDDDEEEKKKPLEPLPQKEPPGSGAVTAGGGPVSGAGTVAAGAAAGALLAGAGRKKDEEQPPRVGGPVRGSKPTHALLEILGGKAAGQTFTILASEQVEVGTSRKAQICLRDHGVGFHHATIGFDKDFFQVVDHSRTGTLLNGEALIKRIPRPLQHGDVLAFGSTQARFTIPGGGKRERRG